MKKQKNPQTTTRWDCCWSFTFYSYPASTTSTTITTTAATTATARGWKRGIPVVTTDWLYACDKVGQCLPLKDYRVLETSPKAAHRHMPIRVPEETNDVPISKENDQTVIKVDLGCCCACHDHDKASTQAQCEWCVDCNVNQIARVT